MTTTTDPQTQPADITAFLTDLARTAKAEKTWRAYRSDLNLFASWLTQTTGDAFAAGKLTRIDVRDYKQHLLGVEGKAAATVNRRLAALRAFCAWAKRTGRVTELATEGIADVPVPRQAPKALDERAVDRVLRRSEQSGNRRDHAILMTLRITGARHHGRAPVDRALYSGARIKYKNMHYRTYMATSLIRAMPMEWPLRAGFLVR